MVAVKPPRIAFCLNTAGLGMLTFQAHERGFFAVGLRSWCYGIATFEDSERGRGCVGPRFTGTRWQARARRSCPR